MADKLVTIAEYADSSEAELAAQILKDFGIESVVVGENSANVFAGVTALASARLQVLQSQAERAMEILKTNVEKEQ